MDPPQVQSIKNQNSHNNQIVPHPAHQESVFTAVCYFCEKYWRGDSWAPLQETILYFVCYIVGAGGGERVRMFKFGFGFFRESVEIILLKKLKSAIRS